MSERQRKTIGARVLDLAAAVLFGAIAVYAAVLLLKAIWIWLCVGAAIAGIAWAIWRCHFRW